MDEQALSVTSFESFEKKKINLQLVYIFDLATLVEGHSNTHFSCPLSIKLLKKPWQPLITRQQIF